MQDISLNKKLAKVDLKMLSEYFDQHNLRNFFEIHGFLTAIVSTPNMIMPSEWMDFLELNDGEFESMEQAQSILGSVMSLYNDICAQLMNKSFKIINLNANSTLEEKKLVNNLWAKGYLLGVGFNEQSWIINDEISSLMLPIFSIRSSDEILQELIDKNNANFSIDELRQYGNDKLADAATSIHQYWLKRCYLPADINRLSNRKEKLVEMNHVLVAVVKNIKVV